MSIHSRYILPLLLCAAPAFANTTNDICDELGRRHSRMGTLCRPYEQRFMDPAALRVIRAMASVNPMMTLDSLHASADHRFDATAAASCGLVARESSLQGRFCLETVRGKTPSPILSQIVTRLAARDSYRAVEVFRVAGTATFSEPLLRICLSLADVNPNQTLECVNNVANKTIAPGAELACLPPRTPGPASMLVCLKNLPSSAAENCEPGETGTTAGTGVAPLVEAARQLQGHVGN